MSDSPIHVCLDARVAPGTTGGVETLVIALANALAALPESRERYSALIGEANLTWAREQLPSSFELLVIPQTRSRKYWSGQSRFGIRDRLRKASYVLRAKLGRRAFPVPREPAVIANNRPSVMHFLTQNSFVTSIPNIYHPHDLQHRHLPDLFTPFQHAMREAALPYFSHLANAVCVSSSWVKRDLQAQYGIAPEKIYVINLPPETRNTAPGALPDGLPNHYLLYPAQTWAHKNHLSLLRAVARLRDLKPHIHCVFTGAQTEFFPTIEREIKKLALSDRVHFLGFVSRPTLASLYARARMVAIPTRFEAASLPMWEAFAAGTPVVASNVTSLPEQAADAAIILDPLDISAWAGAIARVWNDAALRTQLIERGRERIAAFDWQRSATRFRALYRHLAGTADADDEATLSAPAAF